MSHSQSPSVDLVSETDVARQRDNLVEVLSACVDEMTSQFVAYAVEDSDVLLWTLCDIIENCLSHGIKTDRERNKGRWFGYSDTGSQVTPFFDWIVRCDTKVDALRECCTEINMMEDLVTPHGKGRAWMRKALMEKRLGEYVNACVYDDVETIRNYYMESALVLNPQIETFLSAVEKLKVLDFNLVLRGVGKVLSYPRRLPTIDYCKYIKAAQAGPQPEVRRKKSTTFSAESLVRPQLSPKPGLTFAPSPKKTISRKSTTSGILLRKTPRSPNGGSADDLQGIMRSTSQLSMRTKIPSLTNLQADQQSFTESPKVRRRKSLKLLDGVTQLQEQLLAAGDQRVYLEGKVAEAEKALEESDFRHVEMLKDLETSQQSYEREAEKHQNEMKTMEKIIVELQKIILDLQKKVDEFETP